MKRIFLLLGFIVIFLSACNNDPHTYAIIETEYGEIKLALYNETPKHRDNFIKLANEGFYDDLLFHRVMRNFMIQGGDPDSKGSPAGAPLGGGGPGYTQPHEINSKFVHTKGAVAAARTGDAMNPDRNSSGSQFYIVHGNKVRPNQLDSQEKRFNFTYTPEQRQDYLDLGGAPFLDMDYTVFGQVVSGFDVIDKIAILAGNQANRPIKDVKMKVRIQ